MFPQLFGLLSIYQANGHLSSGYIDDSWLMGPIWVDCATKNVVDTVKLLDTLGFGLVFLGFILDSVSMLVYLTLEKALS